MQHGKSLFSLAYGIDSVVEEKYKRFLIAKPIINVESGSSIGLESGISVFERLVSDYLKDLVDMFAREAGIDIDSLIRKNNIQFVDLHYLKGRSFDNTIIFLDDIQDTSPESVIEVVVRIGNNSKLIVAGDPVFQKLRQVERDPSAIIREILLSEERTRVIDLGIRDVVRYGAKKGLKLLLELRLRQRNLSMSEKEVLNIAKSIAPDADIVTVMDLTNIKDTYGITSEATPDIILITKTPGRLIGRGGERISKIESEINKKLRSIELSLDFKEWIKAIHPVTWISRYIVDSDFVGPSLKVVIDSDGAGPFIGQKGIHIRFLDSVFNELFGISVEVKQIEHRKRRR
jgi:phosphate starvation-inducible protein PhoH